MEKYRKIQTEAVDLGVVHTEVMAGVNRGECIRPVRLTAWSERGRGQDWATGGEEQVLEKVRGSTLREVRGLLCLAVQSLRRTWKNT